MEENFKYIKILQQKKHTLFDDKHNLKYTIEILGKNVCFHFQNRDFARPALACLSGLIVNNNIESSTNIYCWQDSCYDIVPVGSEIKDERWCLRGQKGVIHLATHNYLTAYNSVDNEYYLLADDLQEWTEGALADLLIEISLSDWLSKQNKYVFHAACIGFGGVGALVAGNSGSGKSTFAVSCMLNPEFDFIADEFSVVCNENEKIKAHSFFKTISLNQDSYKMLSLDNVSTDFKILRENKLRDNKMMLLPNSSKFSDSLNIDYLLVPTINESEQPYIKKIDKAKVLMPLVQSTLDQMYQSHESKLVVKLLGLLKNLPAYQIVLSKNMECNQECFKNFVLENKTLFAD